jgi:hypothetical protein
MLACQSLREDRLDGPCWACLWHPRDRPQALRRQRRHLLQVGVPAQVPAPVIESLRERCLAVSGNRYRVPPPRIR